MEKTIKFCKGFFFSVGLFLLYYLICPNLLSILLKKPLSSNNFWVYNFAYLAIYVFTFLILILVVHKDIVNQFKEFLKEPKKYLNKGFSYWAYGMIVMIISNLIVSSLIGNIAVNEQVTRETLISSPIYAIPTIIFFGPFLEELVFRFGLRKSFNKKYTFAFFSAGVFGILHVLTAIDEWTLANLLSHLSEFLFIVPYGSLGFFFAKAYYETDNIFSSIIPHMLHNSLSIFLILLANFLG